MSVTQQAIQICYVSSVLINALQNFLRKDNSKFLDSSLQNSNPSIVVSLEYRVETKDNLCSYRQ